MTLTDGSPRHIADDIMLRALPESCEVVGDENDV